MSNVDRDLPPTAQPPPPAASADAARTTQPLGYQSSPRAGGAVIDLTDDGASIQILYHYDRPWGLVVGFGLFVLALTGKIVYDAVTRGRAAVNAGFVVGAVLLALLALAAAVRGGTPPLHLIANSRGLRMRGGVMNETAEWRRDEILAVTAENLDQPHSNNTRISVVVEFRDEEYAVFPVATKEEQAAIVQALRSALKLPPTTPAASA